MKRKIYETAALINAALEDEQIQSVISHIKEIITSNSGEIKEIEDWGRRRLAYPIKKSKIGYYFIVRFYANPELISTLERFYKLDENIIRFLTIRLSQVALEQIEKNKKPQQEEVEEEIELNEGVENDSEEKEVKLDDSSVTE